MSTGTYIHVDWVPCTHIIPECSATEWQTSMFYGEVYSVSEHVHCTIVCCCPYGMLYQILNNDIICEKALRSVGFVPRHTRNKNIAKT